jgi:hypothetical protein
LAHAKREIAAFKKSKRGRNRRRGSPRRRGKRKWIQHALRHHKKGSLHRQLGIPVGKKIPLTVLRAAAKSPGLLGQRARLALNLRNLRRRKSRR